MWRGSWRFLSQVRRSSNVPLLSCLPSAHLGLQRLRLLSPPLNGSCATCFSVAAEAANMANSAEAEAISSVDHAEMVVGSTDERLAPPESAALLKFDGEQGENALIKIIEEHRNLVTTLRAELEEQKTLTSLILDEIRILKSKGDAKSADENREPPSKGGSSIFEDPECVKVALYKSPQASESISQSSMNLTGKAEASTERTAPLAPQWKCPRCSFMNLDTKHRCVECSRRRPQRTYTADVTRSDDQARVVDEGTEGDAIKVKEKKSSLVSSPVQGRGNLKGQSSLASHDTESDESSSEDAEKNVEVKDPFDVLDDILDSKDSDEDEESLDECKEKTRGGGKPASSLSGLFTRISKREPDRRNETRPVGPAGRRPSRGGLPRARDSNRRVSLDTDEDGSNPSDEDLPSRKGSDYQDEEGYARRPGRERYNNGRGRGGGRGYRGDFHDERRRDKSPRGPREYSDRDRDRGSRSDSYGGRSERGRSRY